MTTDLHNKWYVRYGLSILISVTGLYLRLALTEWVGPGRYWVRGGICDCFI